jgi:hypothetical protein
MSNVTTSWKSTLLGILIGTLNLMLSGVNWKTALISAGATALGAVVVDPSKSK